MPCFIAHSVVDGVDSTANRKNAILKGFTKAVELANAINGTILIVLPSIQNVRNGVLADALGAELAKHLEKPNPFQIGKITISRIASRQIPVSIQANTVVWMVHPQLITAEAVTKVCSASTNIIATEWVPFDELKRWRTDNHAKVI
ncbi:hypothetical protein [Pectobacterium odoriferum]|uniref:hypothetical protein n=1 Tax=Pectobacterium odoriferum TaxID=78398 RepID=UPI00052A54D2|nr:hypothetical protein [Pectobacterium odoriferum]AIU88091.1 hypothetical protein BCS7_08025 [Pectobacterium odoriferum]POE20214.1 hypothetical protein BV918_00645 [Pectobacterium odoriferum]POE36934.1 hypothetical protein BV922_00645 [Pectobacterium odoriferum]